MQKGLVKKSTGSWYEVQLEDGTMLSCRIVGKLRLDDLKSTNPIAVGDYVSVEVDEEAGEGQIKKVLPRTNYVVRQSPRKKHNVHLIASNIDQAVLVVTVVNPDIKTGFIDRFLLMTEPYTIPVIIVFNKADLYNESDLELYQALKHIYEHIGYEVHLTSVVSGLGVAQLRDKLKDKTTLLSGQSGVGKSSLINVIQPQLDLRTDEISDYTGKGQHTTTFAEMWDLDFGGRLIDTPGIKTLSFNHLEVLDVAHNFREIFEWSEGCKFHNCTHRNEPKCAVKDAVSEGKIYQGRYSNYLQLVEEVEDQNYWERHKDI